MHRACPSRPRARGWRLGAPRHGEPAARERHQLHRQRDVGAVGDEEADPLERRLQLTVVQPRQNHVDLAEDQVGALVVAVHLGQPGARVDHDAADERPEMVQEWRQPGVENRDHVVEATHRGLAVDTEE
jgi:hypothetical protein